MLSHCYANIFKTVLEVLTKALKIHERKISKVTFVPVKNKALKHYVFHFKNTQQEVCINS